MGMKYWAGRQQAALSMAHDAATATTRLIHYDLAGRYGVRAASFPLPGLPLPASPGNAEAARPTLHLRPPPANDPHAAAPMRRASAVPHGDRS